MDAQRIEWERAEWAALQARGTEAEHTASLIAAVAWQVYRAALQAHDSECELGDGSCDDSKLGICSVSTCERTFCFEHGQLEARDGEVPPVCDSCSGRGR